MEYIKIIFLSFCIISYPSGSKGQVRTKEKFSFIALGDMPYFLPEDYFRFENLINTVNKQEQIFNLFLGDFKASKVNCSEEVFSKMYNYFEQFKKPLIYTPGDNEWTDCYLPQAGAYDPEERLSVLRKIFFKEPKSLGKEKLNLISQASFPGYEKFVENYRWSYSGVTFATLHVVGSNNNFNADSKDLNKEFFERNEANLFWLKETFRIADEEKSLGIVLVAHADMFTADKGISGFTDFLKALQSLTEGYAKPVLLVNGDSHDFKVDKPIYTDRIKKKALLNFTRVQVFGEANMYAVKIVVNPANPALFEIQELWVPGNN